MCFCSIVALPVLLFCQKVGLITPAFLWFMFAFYMFSILFLPTCGVLLFLLFFADNIVLNLFF